MAVELSLPAVAHSRSFEPLPIVAAADPALEKRWAEWRARGRRNDMAVRRNLRWIALIAAIAAVLVTLFVVAGGSR